MRKAFVTATLGLILFAALIPATTASAGAARRVRYYEGPTSEGGRLRISVVVKNGVPYLNLLLIEGPYSCEDGSQGEIVDDGVGWFPRGPAIVDASLDVLKRHNPSLLLAYLPHLDYNLQRLGPDDPKVDKDLAAIDTEAGRLIDAARERGGEVVVLSEYAITAVSKPVHINRVLRDAGLLVAEVTTGVR